MPSTIVAMDRSKRPSGPYQINQMSRSLSSSRNDMSHSSGHSTAPAQGRLEMLPDLQVMNPVSHHLYKWYADRDGPWHPRISNPQAILRTTVPPPSFMDYRSNNVPSESGTLPSVVPGSDSGYGTAPRPSIGNMSVYEGADQSFDTQSLTGHFKDVNIQGFGQMASPNDYRPEGDNWAQGVHGAMAPTRNIDSMGLTCATCHKTVKTKSELTKHTHRHTKPHRCAVMDCSRHFEGFSTTNDLERHMKSVHGKSGTRYRCNQGQCSGKEKPWPRADNFRQHLKRVHKIETSPHDDLKAYIIRGPPSSDLLLAGMGSAEPLNIAESQDSPHTLNLSEGQEDLSGPVLTPPDGQDDLVQAWSYPEDHSILANLGVRDAATANQLDALLRDPALHSQGMNRDLSETSTVQPSYSQSLSNISSGMAQSQVTDPVVVSTKGRSLPLSGNGAPKQLATHAYRPTNDHFIEPTFLPNSQSHFELARTPRLEMHGLVTSSQPGSSGPADLETLALIDETVEDVPSTEQLIGSPSSASSVYATTPPASIETNTHANSTDSQRRPFEEDIANPETQPAGNNKMKEARLLLEDLRQAGKLDELMLDCGYQKTGKAAKQGGKASSSIKQPPKALRVSCKECNKKFNRPSELKKHAKRHDKPYACTHAKCDKTFGSKNDWKRHEISQHFRSEYWECKSLQAANSTDQCGKTFHRRESFRHHIKTDHGVNNEKLIDTMCRDCHLGKDCESGFWCGYCTKTVEHQKKGVEAWSERFDHIDDHNNGRNGLPKKDIGLWQHPVTSRATEEDTAGLHGSTDEAVEWDDPFPDLVIGKLQALPSGSAKRKNSAVGRENEQAKRPKSQSDSAFWTCCRCNATWDSKHAKCLTGGCQHDPCGECKNQVHRSDEQPRPSRRTDDTTWMWICCVCGGYWGWATTDACVGSNCSHHRCQGCGKEQVMGQHES